ncbi:MAG: YaaA family protein [Candidatus Omnitrophica bacterium]|nr:YaaA family protein [Candidatus Omnitrophota bacterium]
MKKFVILIPPSEGKKKGGKGSSLGKASKHTEAIIKKLKDPDQNWGKVLGVKGKALEEAVQSNRQILSSSTMPAIERYTGVVYSAVDYPSLTAKAKTFFNQHVRIVSAVFGLVKPVDLIPDYKLKIDKLGTDKYWQPIVQEELKGAFIVDLLPQAHRKAVNYENGIAVDFSFVKNGKKIPAGHHGKHIKGRFIRWLAEHQCTDPDSFKNFKEDGMRWRDSEFIKTVG